MAARDYRAVVPRTPPEGLQRWALEHMTGEPVSGLVYEAEWAVDDYYGAVLEDRKPKKVRMVRVKCSACGDSMLCHYGRASYAGTGYGFIHPGSYAESESGEVSADLEVTLCPMCECPVKVIRGSRLGATGYEVIHESWPMSASVLETGELVLTGWKLEVRCYRNATERVAILPAEAYVFHPGGCEQLLGWRSSYSGNKGYFVTFDLAWRQPKEWRERWGAAKHIFGLTPELVASSCLPHCKLDAYMDSYSSISPKYPVVWMRLYQAHPNAEVLLTNGLPLVLDNLIRYGYDDGFEEGNRKGVMDLPDIDWSQTRPSKMLHLTREELRLGQDQCWGVFLWRLFVETKQRGEILTADQMRMAFELGDDNLMDLIGVGPVGKSIEYLIDNLYGYEPEPDDSDPYCDDIPDATTLLDYWDMVKKVGKDLNDPQVRFPDDLLKAHDDVLEFARQLQNARLAHSFRVRRKILAKYSFQADGLMIFPAGSQRELDQEGNALHHCVSTYGSNYAEGKTAIFFIRRTEAPKKPYFTLELDEKDLKVRQNRGKHNCARTEEVQAFEDRWLAWVRAGCKRDQRGRPVEPIRRQGVA